MEPQQIYKVKVVLWDIGNLMKAAELPLQIIQEMAIMELLLPSPEIQQLIQPGKRFLLEHTDNPDTRRPGSSGLTNKSIYLLTQKLL